MNIKKRKLTIDRIIGTTSDHALSIATNPFTHEIAYLAGYIIITYDPKQNEQTRFLSIPTPTRFSISKSTSFHSICYSMNGKYLAATSLGRSGLIDIWDLEMNHWMTQIKFNEFSSSQLLSIGFTQNPQYLISLGYIYPNCIDTNEKIYTIDSIESVIQIWDLEQKKSIFSTQINKKINSFSISPSGSQLITISSSQLKIWSFDHPNYPKSIHSIGSIIITDLLNSNLLNSSFNPNIDLNLDTNIEKVVWGRKGKEIDYSEYGYIITLGNNLILFSILNLKIISKVDLKCKTYDISFSPNGIAIACQDGIVRLYDPSNLNYITTIPKPNPIRHEFRSLNSSSASNSRLNSNSNSTSNSKLLKYSDTISVGFDPDGYKLCCFYRNQSFFIWDLKDTSHVSKYRSFLGHSTSINTLDIITLPSYSIPNLHHGTILTGSSDGLIRCWDIFNPSNGLDHDTFDLTKNQFNNFESTQNQSLNSNSTGSNLYCKDLCHVIVTQSIQSSKEPIFDQKTSFINFEKSLSPNLLADEIHCLSISPDGQHLAIGHKSGNLIIYALDGPYYQRQWIQEVHESQISTLCYSSNIEKTKKFIWLASGSRDRLIHLFQRQEDEDHPDVFPYILKYTIDDHSAAITSIAFHPNGLDFYSTSADKSIIFHRMNAERSQVKRIHNLFLNSRLFDVKVIPFSNQMVVAGQDKKLTIYDLESAKLEKSWLSPSEGDLIKIDIDPLGLLLATCSQDRVVRIMDLKTGEIIALGWGHGKTITSIKFIPNSKKLVTISADGCMFIWKLGKIMNTHLLNMGKKLSTMRLTKVGKMNLLNQLNPLNPSNHPSCYPNWMILKLKTIPIYQTRMEKIIIEKMDNQERLIRKGIGKKWIQRMPSSGFLLIAISSSEGSIQGSVQERIQDQTQGFMMAFNSSKIGGRKMEEKEDLIYLEQYPEQVELPCLIGIEMENRNFNELKVEKLDSIHSEDDQFESGSFLDQMIAKQEQVEREAFSRLENTDHSFTPTRRLFKGRRSISANFFLNHIETSLSSIVPNTEIIQCQREDKEGQENKGQDENLEENKKKINSVEEEAHIKLSNSIDYRRERLANAVERTRARLAMLGIDYISKKESKLTPNKNLTMNSLEGLESLESLESGKLEQLESLDTLKPLEIEQELEPLDTLEPPLFLKTLSMTFDRTVELYYDLKENNAMQMANQIHQVLKDMQCKLDLILGKNLDHLKYHNIQGSDHMNLLDHYSKLLVDLVEKKVNQLKF